MFGQAVLVAVLVLPPGLASAQTAGARLGVESIQYRQDPDGDRREPYGDRREPYGDRREPYRDQREPYGDRREPYGDRREPGRERRESSGDRGGQSGAGGSFQQSCRDVRQQGSTLTAVCRDGRGRLSETAIDISRCGRSDIGNRNGTLACGGNLGNSRRIE